MWIPGLWRPVPGPDAEAGTHPGPARVLHKIYLSEVLWFPIKLRLYLTPTAHPIAHPSGFSGPAQTATMHVHEPPLRRPRPSRHPGPSSPSARTTSATVLDAPSSRSEADPAELADRGVDRPDPLASDGGSSTHGALSRQPVRPRPPSGAGA